MTSLATVFSALKSKAGLVKLGSTAPVGRYLTILASMSWRLTPAPPDAARYLPSGWNTDEVPRLDAMVMGDDFTWDCSAPDALNSAMSAPLSAKMWQAACPGSAVTPPIALTATMPPVPKLVSRLPSAL